MYEENDIFGYVSVMYHVDKTLNRIFPTSGVDERGVALVAWWHDLSWAMGSHAHSIFAQDSTKLDSM